MASTRTLSAPTSQAVPTTRVLAIPLTRDPTTSLSRLTTTLTSISLSTLPPILTSEPYPSLPLLTSVTPITTPLSKWPGTISPRTRLILTLHLLQVATWTLMVISRSLERLMSHPLKSILLLHLISDSSLWLLLMPKPTLRSGSSPSTRRPSSRAKVNALSVLTAVITPTMDIPTLWPALVLLSLVLLVNYWVTNGFILVLLFMPRPSPQILLRAEALR